MLRVLVDEARLPVEQENGALARLVRGPGTLGTIVVRVPAVELSRAPDLKVFFSDHETYLERHSE